MVFFSGGLVISIMIEQLTLPKLFRKIGSKASKAPLRKYKFSRSTKLGAILGNKVAENKKVIAAIALAGVLIGPNIIERLKAGESLDDALLGAPQDAAEKIREAAKDVVEDTVEDVGDVSSSVVGGLFDWILPAVCLVGIVMFVMMYSKR